MLARVDAGKLRRDAGFTQATVAAALGLSQYQVSVFERGVSLPRDQAGFRWVKFIGALERRAAGMTEPGEAA
jgi:transcriptional regulator with XRE-family HTH domain